MIYAFKVIRVLIHFLKKIFFAVFLLGILRIKTLSNIVDVRISRYTKSITIMREHKIRAYGKFVTPNVFVTQKIENLTTGEYWEIIPIRTLKLRFLLMLVLFVIIFLTMGIFYAILFWKSY